MCIALKYNNFKLFFRSYKKDHDLEKDKKISLKPSYLK